MKKGVGCWVLGVGGGRPRLLFPEIENPRLQKGVLRTQTQSDANFFVYKKSASAGRPSGAGDFQSPGTRAGDALPQHPTPNTHRRRVAALTLVELMVAAVIVAILTLAVTYAFVAGLDMERNQARYALEQDAVGRMKQRVTRLLQGAKLSSDATDTSTFFVGEAQGGEDQLGCDRLTFTTIAPAVSLAAQASEDDFETQQKTLGPQGGMAEASLSVTAQGDAGNKTGLFERVQRPSDSDYTQGGMESLLEEQVKQIGFQFYNGTAWVATWDTVNGGEKRLPSAVRVNYILKDDPKETIHAFTVPLATSDVDAQNPSTNGETL